MPTFGPEYGELTLRTTRAGLASRVGHDLTIVISDWSADLTLRDGSPDSVALSAALASMIVAHGAGGLKPLSDSDKRSIIKNALRTLSAGRFPYATFASRKITGESANFSIEGVITIAGVARTEVIPVETTRSATETTATVSTVVTQKSFGVTPYSAMLGALRVSDAVTIDLRLTVPNALLS